MNGGLGWRAKNDEERVVAAPHRHTNMHNDNPNRDLPVCLAEHPHALLTPPALLMRLDLHRAIDWRNPTGEDGAYRRTAIRVPVEVRGSMRGVEWVDGWMEGYVHWGVGPEPSSITNNDDNSAPAGRTHWPSGWTST